MRKRKRNEKLEGVLVHLPKWLIDELTEDSTELGISRSELIRRLLVAGHEMERGLDAGTNALFGDSVMDNLAKGLLQALQAQQLAQKGNK